MIWAFPKRACRKSIVELWYKVENAAIVAIKTGCSITVNSLTFTAEGDFLTITLPSKHKLFYAHPEIDTNQWGKPSVTYCGVDQTSKQWTRIETYGGKWVENIVQAVARDVIKCTADKVNLAEVLKLMTEPIPWAQDLPLSADGWFGESMTLDFDNDEQNLLWLNQFATLDRFISRRIEHENH
ncbi:MAG: hypothetical protein SR3Q1_09620 [Quinella sp. 3Q1]|nr:hypothetical protein [Quinella sp. 3Q1]MBR6887051.1 hypothetical protein [Selenomonadaceae bacterium]